MMLTITPSFRASHLGWLQRADGGVLTHEGTCQFATVGSKESAPHSKRPSCARWRMDAVITVAFVGVSREQGAGEGVMVTVQKHTP